MTKLNQQMTFSDGRKLGFFNEYGPTKRKLIFYCHVASAIIQLPMKKFSFHRRVSEDCGLSSVYSCS
jgi:hypothetical protein